MLVKVLGLIDFIGGVLLLFASGAKFPIPLLVIMGIILLIKAGIGLLRDFASWIDFIAGGIFILLVFFSVPGVFCIIAGILLIQKGVVSFL